MNRAISFQAANNYQQALRYFNIAIQLKPTLWEAYERVGEILMISDKPGAALEVLNKGIEVAPKEPELWYQRSKAHFGENDLKDAMEDINHAIALMPSNFSYVSKRADFEALSGDLQKALSDRTKAIQLINPLPRDATDAERKKATTDRSMAFKDRGNILRSLGKYQAAIDDYGTALKLNPATGSRLKILSDRASCYDKVGQHDLAEKDRKQASPGSHEILNDLMK